MAEQNPAESLFLRHLSIIDGVAGSLARRHGLSGDEAADFKAWIRLKLIEDDYAVLRKFRGESAIGTYLTVVIAMLARDYRAQHWGRWRPSAAARRSGELAVRLETLVHRKGHRLSEAGEILRTAGETTLSDRELAGIFAQLPSRLPIRPVAVGAEPLNAVEASDGADTLVAERIRDEEQRLVQEALEQSLSDFTPEDRLIVRLCYWEDMSVADIARGLRLEQKPLYRRLNRMLATLRTRLTQAGVTEEHLAGLLDKAAP
jgi:RNA polymerase sigma factor for flagellar operon FliA